jgi:ribonuclease-3
VTARRKSASAGVDLASLQSLVEYEFQDVSLLERALVHSSAATEGAIESNQTLEFLGDAVLDLAVSEFLLRRHPDRAEGELTRMRASIVSAKGLAEAAGRLELGRWIRLGRGEARSGGGKKANILADTYEALIAAVFLDGGYDAARRVVEVTFAKEIESADPVGGDWKTELQELTQSRFHCTPSYSLVSVTGPDHAKHFEVAIRLAGEQIARGEGANRKSAEQMAAQEAVKVLADRPPIPEPAEAKKKAPARPRKRKPAADDAPSNGTVQEAAPSVDALQDTSIGPFVEEASSEAAGLDPSRNKSGDADTENLP